MVSKYGDYYHHPGEQNTANENILEFFQRLCAEAGFRLTDSYGPRKYTIASILIGSYTSVGAKPSL